MRNYDNYEYAFIFELLQMGDHKLKDCEVLQCTCGELVSAVVMGSGRQYSGCGGLAWVEWLECRVFPGDCPNTGRVNEYVFG